MLLTVLEVVLILYPIVCSIFKQTNYLAQFVLAICGMLPLAKRIGSLVEDLCKHYCSRLVAGFIAATLGNFPELIFGTVAVYNNQMHLMSAAMFGSPMSNILLVFGTSIIAGTFFKGKNDVCFKHKTIHCVGVNLTLISALSYSLVVIVTLLNSNGVTQNEKIGLSEIIAICNFITYSFFTLNKLFNQHNTNNILNGDILIRGDVEQMRFLPGTNSFGMLNSYESINSVDTINISNNKHKQTIDSESDDLNLNNNEPKPYLYFIVLMMVVVTICITLLSDIITNTVDLALEGSSVSKTFIGIIILPFICNAVEHVSAIFQMLSDDENAADGAMEIASGSAYQVLGFVVPIINFLSFGSKDIFTFDIDPLILITLNFTTIILAVIVANNRLDMFEGLSMTLIWVMIGGTFFVYDAVIS